LNAPKLNSIGWNGKFKFFGFRGPLTSFVSIEEERREKTVGIVYFLLVFLDREISIRDKEKKSVARDPLLLHSFSPVLLFAKWLNYQDDCIVDIVRYGV